MSQPVPRAVVVAAVEVSSAEAAVLAEVVDFPAAAARSVAAALRGAGR